MTLMQSVCKTMITLDILFALLLAFSYPHLDPGSGSYVVAQLTLVPVLLTFCVSCLILYFEWDPFAQSPTEV
ncbi:hypothetical protein [Halostagnicola sp. A-GB9-2]|uniref:hypothetical protein n=1 Tax=Halostagnicola sp. A-GB9-2 TaxID=3048066 RepID=UPI0024BF989D|nr:hypothetical protein [Halostagnicola sp. A-GB9-2]MDJ1433628.1 hypothetical protein [Halostagnicola sp. A-GB9-2]